MNWKISLSSYVYHVSGLQKLWIESGIGDDLEPTQSDSSQYFVSTLAELIAFRRMPHLTVSFG